MRPIFKDTNQQAFFAENGYVIVDLLNADELSDIRKSLTEMRPDDGFAPKGRASDYHCTFLDTNLDYKEAVYDLICKYFQPLLDRYVHEFTILNGNFYVKPAGSGTFEIHQNWHHNPRPQDTTLTIWCPLLDVTRKNGTLEVVPGSHKIVPDIATVNVPYYFKNFEQALLDKYLEPIPLKAGQGLLFDDSLIHYSSQNEGAEPRTAIQIETHPVEMQPVYYHIDREQPEADFEVFEVSRSFFLNGNINNMTRRPEGLSSIGFQPNINKLLTEEEFLEKMAAGPTTRAELYAKT